MPLRIRIHNHDKSYKKINGAANALGNEGFVNAISECMGIEIDNYLAFDLDAVRDIVDHVGGVDIDIPAGIRDGEKIRLLGKGNPGTVGSPPGDLYIRIKIC